MARILFLAHRMPYPPNKGDKIRSWNMLKYLLKSHQVHLGCFVDDPADFAHVDFLRKQCSSVNVIDLTSRFKKIYNVLRGFLTGEPLSVSWYRSKKLQSYVDGLIGARDVDVVILFSSATARFVMKHASNIPVIMDFVDMDSDKWQQYAKSKSFPLNTIYDREARTLLAFEKKICTETAASIFVTDDEVALFCSHLPKTIASKVSALHNGVDADYFSPDHALENIPAMGSNGVSFTGAMDYWANVDAVVWFADHVWPKVLEVVPDAMFYIVGGKPDKKVQELALREHISVTGRVEDVRPFVAASKLAVAPMRIARGVQNKVLEAMAMAKPVITTPMGFEGITATPGQDLIVAESDVDFAATVIQLLQGGMDTTTMGERARQLVLDNYSWDANLAGLEKMIKDC